MVVYKNVTMQFNAVVQEGLGDRTLGNPKLSDDLYDFNGFLETLEPGEAYNLWGIALKEPAVFYAEVSDFLVAARVVAAEGLPALQGRTAAALAKSLINAQATVTAQLRGGGSFLTNVYEVQGRPVFRDDGMECDHVEFRLSRKEFPL